MRGYRTGYLRTFTNDYHEQQRQVRQERIAAYRQQVERRERLFESDTSKVANHIAGMDEDW
jgi:hypothetical protein